MKHRHRLESGFLKPIGAACFLMLILTEPSSAMQAAAQTLHSWAVSVAPSLLPFLLVMPALTCEETCRLLSKVFSPLIRFFRLPRNSSGALLIGLLSGSPAGAAALLNVQREPSDSDGSFLRASLIASGASGAFLLSGIAVGMLNAPETGFLLLRSQLASVFFTALLLRFFGSDHTSAHPPAVRSQSGAVPSAMLTLLNIGGYMVLFSVLSRQLSRLISPALEVPLLALMELSGGCQALSALNVPLDVKLPLISAAACFGGISVYAQSLSFLLPAGVDPVEYAAGKLLQAAFAAAFTYVQLEYLPLDLSGAMIFLKQIDPAVCAMLIAACLLLMVMLHTLFSRYRLRR